MITLKQVNKALKANGIEYELVKGDGYFYFAPIGKDDRFGPTVYCCGLNEMPIERWVEEIVKFDFDAR